MKKYIGIIIAIGIATATPAVAQRVGVHPLLNGGTNSISAGTTNSALFQNVVEHNAVTLQATAKGHSGTASNLQFYVFRSSDGENFETDPFTVLQLRLSGTTVQSALTNIDTTGVSSLKILPANTNAVVVTNLTLKARIK